MKRLPENSELTVRSKVDPEEGAEDATGVDAGFRLPTV